MRLAGHPVRWQLLAALAESDLRVRELVTRVAQPQNLVSYHLRQLRGGGLVTVTRSTFDGRDSYYHLDLDRCAAALVDSGTSLHPSLRLDAAPPPSRARVPHRSVLFVCTGNSARSPIAEALLDQHTASGVEVASAGTYPKSQLHPLAVRVLAERFGVDVAARRPRHLNTLTGRRFDYVITLCDKAREVRVDHPGRPRFVHWSVPDPAAAGPADRPAYSAFSATAAAIDTRVRHLLPVLAAT
jgi:ArsR family transcriptional regulator, arsenate/arsenite/antimonite-responsive transcriptional repressor / arsenate reductase (thioredoxin)